MVPDLFRSKKWYHLFSLFKYHLLKLIRYLLLHILLQCFSSFVSNTKALTSYMSWFLKFQCLVCDLNHQTNETPFFLVGVFLWVNVLSAFGMDASCNIKKISFETKLGLVELRSVSICHYSQNVSPSMPTAYILNLHKCSLFVWKYWICVIWSAGEVIQVNVSPFNRCLVTKGNVMY
jgi:hypothetical protein